MPLPADTARPRPNQAAPNQAAAAAAPILVRPAPPRRSLRQRRRPPRPWLRRKGGAPSSRRRHVSVGPFSRRLRIVALVLVASAAGATTTGIVRDAEQQRSAWGMTRSVPTATHDLETGAVIQPGDVAWADRPIAALPRAAMDSDPVGRVMLTRTIEGEPFNTDRLAPNGATGLTALITAGRVAVALPTDDRTPPLATGQTVDLYSPAMISGLANTTAERDRPTPSRGPSPPSAARRISHQAGVIDVSDRRITVTIAREDVAVVAAEVINAAIIIVVLGPDLTER